LGVLQSLLGNLSRIMEELLAKGTHLGRLSLEAEKLFRVVVECVPEGILLVDPYDAIKVVNRKVERQFGYPCNELIGRPVDLLIPGGLRTTYAASRARFITGLTAIASWDNRTLFGRHRDGSRLPIEIGVEAIETDQGTFVLATVVDATTRRASKEQSRPAVEGHEFERMVAELSVEFINLPFDEVDGAIRVALSRIGQALELDRCTFYEIQPDGLLTNPLSWERSSIPPMPAPTPARELFPWSLETVLGGSVVCFSRVDEIPNPIDRSSYRSFGTQSSVTVPLSVADRVVGAVDFNIVRHERTWLAEEIHRVRVFASAFGSVLARRQGDKALHHHLAEVQQLRERLHDENLYLPREAQELLGSGILVGKSAAVRCVLEQIQQVAATDSTVLLLGETGTGKELFATYIHELSGRRGRTMVRVNCSAIPATLMESELFGHEKGAFTGALARRMGRFELADHSTIFLDEIGDLPAEIQVKLLRVLEERQIERLGNSKPIHVDVRIIAATHRNLERRIAEGAFREDLFYRLNVFPIQVPPLRDRVEDIPLLMWRFVEQFGKAFGKQIEAIPRDNLSLLERYSWPGNIRELRNVVERAVIVAKGTRLSIALPAPSYTTEKQSAKLTDVEKEHIRTVLESTGWRIRGFGGAAERLGLRPTTLETRMAKLGLTRPKAS
jgi:formate hydrogenlyase transcriptional activator